MDAILPDRPASKWPRPELLGATAVFLGIAIGLASVADPIISIGLAGLLFLAVLILPRPKNGLYLIAAALPFESLIGLESAVTPVKAIVAMTFAAWLIKLIRTRRTSIGLSDPNHLVLLLFFVVALLSLSQAHDFTAGVSRLATLGFLMAFYVMIPDLVDDGDSLIRVMSLLVLSGGLSALALAVQFFGGNAISRISGSFADPNYAALSLTILAPLALALTHEIRGGRRFNLQPIAWLLLASSLLTRSRGGLLVALAMLLFLAVNSSFDRRVRQNARTLLIIAAAATAFLVLSDKRFALQTIMSSRGAGRFEIWDISRLIFADHWWLGVGLANFANALYNYVIHETWVLPWHVRASVAHSLYIETAIETGALGIALFLVFIGQTLWRGKKVLSLANDMGIPIAKAYFMVRLSLIGLLIGSLSLSTLYLKIFWLMLGLERAARHLVTRALNDSSA